MNKLYISLTSLLLVLTSPLMAQDSDDESSTESTTEESGSRRFWQANLPGGSYVVALSAISSVSKHTYVIDGSLRVTEVVVDTTGNSLARFYYIIPVSDDADSNVAGRITERGRDILETTTTHAKTVEFRISDEGDLDKLLGSVRKAWMNGNGKKFTIVQK